MTSRSPVIREDLGADGIDYIRSSLAGGLTLSQLVSETDLAAGSAYTFVPPGTSPQRLRRWNEGGLMGSDQGLEALVAELRPLLQTQPAVLLAENPMAKPGDEWVQNRSDDFFIHQQEVYEYCPANSGYDEIKMCLRTADASYSLNAVAATGVASPQQDDDQRYLRRVADGARLLITRAYDGESLVLWRPAGPASTGHL